MLISLIPLLGTLSYLIYKSTNDLAFQALLIATLPRQIMMIQNMDILIQNFTDWTDIKERLNGLKNALVVSAQSPEKRIQWDKIQFYSCSQPLQISSIQSIKEQIGQPNRITIRGENGSGKTTLLKCLKEKFGGYYLPPNPNMSFANENWQTLSTGEKILTAINEIGINNQIDNLLLLDEWDANLDSRNRQKISNQIDRLSKTITIIEVVHRTEDIFDINQ
jgi:ABC-type bacteriocin/lantibiotic exporter with double-glycine peptidase domain